MKLKIREGTISDDELCGTIMLGALVSADIPRSFLKDDVLILPCLLYTSDAADE